LGILLITGKSFTGNLPVNHLPVITGKLAIFFFTVAGKNVTGCRLI
jgi:hypothetical protein